MKHLDLFAPISGFEKSSSVPGLIGLHSKYIVYNSESECLQNEWRAYHYYVKIKICDIFNYKLFTLFYYILNGRKLKYDCALITSG